jgi:acyl-CoA thioesterase
MHTVKEFVKNDRFADYCGVELVEVSEGRATARMRIEDHHRNGIGTVHGGALFALAHLALAAAANSRGTLAVATNASIWYVKPTREGSLLATAREVSLEAKLATYAIEVTDEDGMLVAVFEGMVYRKKQALAKTRSSQPD